MIKKIIAFFKKRREIARRKRVARFMRDQALGSYSYYIGFSDK